MQTLASNRKRTHFAALLALGCSTFACTKLLGIDDLEIREADAVGGSSGSGGSAGAAGSAGGDAGSGGQTDLRGCDGEPFTPNSDVILSCMLRAGCSPFEPEATISECITQNRHAAFPGEACAVGASSCDDIDTCRGEGWANDYCAENTELRCEGNVGIACGDDSNYFVDCDKWGGTCTVENGAPECIVKDACSETDTDAHCDGSIVYTCGNGVGLGFDCKNFGADCAADADGSMSCVYSLPSCPPPESRCSGGSAQVCMDGELLNFPCTTVGLTCAEAEPECLASGCTAADRENCEEFCSGPATISLCYGGVAFEADCTAFGFDRCDVFDSDTGVARYAQCWNGNP